MASVELRASLNLTNAPWPKRLPRLAPALSSTTQPPKIGRNANSNQNEI